MKRILILVAFGFLMFPPASAFQGGGGESTKKGSSKKAVPKKKTSGTSPANTTPPRPPASTVPTRTPAPVKAQAEDRERQYEAIRIARITERTRVEQGLAGEWSDGSSRLTITKDGGGFSAEYVSRATNVLGDLLPQSLHGELLPDNQLKLANNSYGKLVNPRYYYSGDFDQRAWIELGVDGDSLIVRFSEAKGGRSLVMKRLAGNADSRVREAATATSAPISMPRTRTGQAGIEFVLISAGEFMMGSSDGRDDEKPAHRVIISHPFYLGKFEVTRGQWNSVMGKNPIPEDCEDCPVEKVSWEQAQQFLAKLNQRNDGFDYGLPTEAQWEFACRAGTIGDLAGVVDSMAWYIENSGFGLHPVGKKQPNAWGLYDMHGSVWEWCQDWHEENYYRSSPLSDPKGPSNGRSRVLRGGSWNDRSDDVRSAVRNKFPPGFRDSNTGFRVVAVARTP